MNTRQPGIGEWYRLRGELFEVVAVDEADATVEVQTFDGTLEEIELEDWHVQCSSGAIQTAEAPEDTSGSIDVEEDENAVDRYDLRGEERRLHTDGIEGLDLFE
ncbi:MAG: hypothetical protein RL684_1302 [Pseudomonadota bacterium]